MRLFQGASSQHKDETWSECARNGLAGTLIRMLIEMFMISSMFWWYVYNVSLPCGLYACSETSQGWCCTLLQSSHRWHNRSSQFTWKLPCHRRWEVVSTKMDPCQVLWGSTEDKHKRGLLGCKRVLSSMGCCRRVRKESPLHDGKQWDCWELSQELYGMWHVGHSSIIVAYSRSILSQWGAHRIWALW